MQKFRARYWPLGIAVVFCCGVFLGTILPHPLVKAQLRTTYQDGEATREAFLAGGDRSYSVLKDIRTELQESRRILREISSTEKRIEQSLRENLSARNQND